MGLTLAEKDHFRTQLQARVDKLIDCIRCEDATWERDLREKAEKLTIERMGIAELLCELEALKTQKAAFVASITDVEERLVRMATGHNAAEPTRSAYRTLGESTSDDTQYPQAMRATFQHQISYMVDQLTDAHPLGHRIKQLQDMRRDYTDKINMVGSHIQLQAVWAEILQHFDGVEPDQRNTRNVRIRGPNVEEDSGH